MARVGQSGEAKQLLSKALQQAKERYVCRFLVGASYAELGENDKALESLEQAFPTERPQRRSPIQDLVRRSRIPEVKDQVRLNWAWIYLLFIRPPSE